MQKQHLAHQYIIKNLFLVCFSILFANFVNSLDKVCKIGCLKCDQNLICSQCQEGFILQEQSNTCVYSQCPSGLFYQLKNNYSFYSNLQNREGVCQAVCDDNNYQMEAYNICINIHRCQLSYQSQTNLNQGEILDVFSYDGQYIITMYDQQLNQYSRSNGLYQQTVEKPQNIIQLIEINQQLFFIQTNLTLCQWDISQNYLKIVNSINENISDYQSVYLVKPQNKIICSIIQLKSKNQLNIQHLYTIKSASIPNEPKIIQLLYDPQQQLQIINEFIIYKKQSSIRIDEITCNDKLEMGLSFFTSQNFICQKIPNSSLSMVQKSITGNYISIIIFQTQNLFILKQNECYEINLQQIPIQTVPVMINNQDYFLIQSSHQFQLINAKTQNIVYQSTLESIIIIDINYSQLVQQANTFNFFILSSENILSVFTIQEVDSQIQIKLYKQFELNVQQPKKIHVLPEVSQTILERIFVVGQDAQSFVIQYEDQQQITEKQQYVLENFNLGYDRIDSPIVSLVFLDNQKTIVACTFDGRLYSWDNGQIYNEIYQNYMEIEDSSCIHLILFNNIYQFDLIALFNNQLIIFDSFNFQIKQRLLFEVSPQISPPLITNYQELIVALFDLSLYIVSQNDYIIQKIQFSNYSTDIQQIYLSQNKMLIVQKGFSLEVYQLDLQNKNAQFIDKYESPTQIQTMKIKNFPQPQYPQIFEIYIFTQDSSFTLLQKTVDSFSVFQTIQSIPLSQTIDITFIKDNPLDNYIFILGITNQQTATLPYQCLVLQKNSQNVISFFSASSAQYLLEPATFFDFNKNLIYHVKVIQNLSFISIIGSQTFNTADLSNFQDDSILLNNVQGSNQIKTNDQNFIYAYDQKGFLGVNVFKSKFYSQFYNLSQSEINSGDIITDVQMSYTLNSYFILRRSIYIYNMNDNSLSQTIQFEVNTSFQISQFFILEHDQAVIACKVNIIKVFSFKDNKINTFADQNFLITKIQITPYQNQNMITVYGNKIVRLNLNLVNEQSVSINFDPLYALSCLFPSNNIICKLNNNQVVILDFKQLTLIQQFTSKNLISTFLIQIDEPKNRLFLYSDSIEVYDMQGVFQQAVSQNSGIIKNFNIFGQSLVLVTSTILVILDRSSLSNLGSLQGSGGGQILNVSYLEDYNHIIIYTNIVRFAQVFIFCLDSLIQVTSLKNQYTQNSITIVTDQIFDKYMNIYAFLDQAGSVTFIDYEGTYQQINILKIREFSSGQSSQLGLRLCTEVNSLLIFSNNVIYIADYAQITSSYKRYALNRGSFSIQISSDDQDKMQDHNKFILLGSNNSIYFYQYQELLYLMNINSKESILDIQFLQQKLIIIIALKSQILKYDISGIENNIVEGINYIQPTEVKKYKFSLFLSENVFLTIDQKLIHYDFLEDQLLNEIQLDQYQRITSYYMLKNQKNLILGFNDGTIIIYNLENKKSIVLDLKLNLGATGYDDIGFIFETESYIWVASLNTQILCLSQTEIQEINRFNFIHLKSSSQQILGIFFVDELNSVIFMNFFKEKVVRCLNINDKQLITSLLLPDSQYNRILITKTLTIFYSTYQLNVHSRQSLKFLTQIRRQNHKDQINSIHIFEDKYYLILSLNQFELLKVNYDNFKIDLFDQVKVQSFKLMQVYYNETQQFLRVTGVSKNQVIDQKYSIQLYELQKSLSQTYCSINIQNKNYIQMQNEINLIIPFKIQQPNLLSMEEQLNSTSNVFMTIYLSSKDLSQVNIQATSQSQITLAPGQGTLPFYNNTKVDISQFDILFVQEEATANFPKEYLILKNFNLIFQKNKQKIVFSKIIKKTYLQNIRISNQILDDISLQIYDNNIVVILNLILEDLSFNFSNSGSFFQFFGCEQIYIYNLIIRNVNITGQNNSLISITNSTLVVINTIQIYQSNLDQLIWTVNTQNLQIQNVLVTYCVSEVKSSSDSKYLFKIQGSLNLNIQHITMNHNTNLKFITTKNQIQKELKVVTLLNDQVTLKQASFSENNFKNNNQSQLIQFYSTNISIESFKYNSNQGNIQFINTQNVEIANSIFQNNTNKDGGALSFINNQNQIVLKNSSFQFNEAFGSGGAIYCQEFTGNFIIDESTNIQYNLASIGGGVRIYNLINDMRDLEMKKLFSSLNIKNNSALLYGQQFATFLQKVNISQIYSDSNSTFQECPFIFTPQSELPFKEQSMYSGKLQIQNLRSGSQLQIYISAMDSNSDFIRFSKDMIKNKSYPIEIEQELLSYYFKIENLDKSQILLNGQNLITSDQYNQSNSYFIFKEVQITSYPQKTNNLLINYQLNNQNSLPILVQIQFRNCQIGEAVKEYSSNIISCTLCPLGSYLLYVPDTPLDNTKDQYKVDHFQCQKCPDSADQCYGSQIMLKDGYWRQDTNSSEIVYCENNPSNCQSQDINSKYGCIFGTLGPLCEECDTEGIVWKNKQFTHSYNEYHICQECNTMKYQILFITLYSLVIAIYSLLNTVFFIQSFKFTQTCYYLRAMSLFPIYKSSTQDKSSFYLKILNNYLQIVSYLIFFKVKLLPQFITEFLDLVQSPLQKFAVSLDCIISSVFQNRIYRIRATQMIYLSIPLGFTILLSLVIVIFQKIMKKRIQTTHIYTLINFLFIFFQPSQIIFFTQSLSCRQIGSNSYQDVDLLISCNDTSYSVFSFPFSICSLIIWILVPLVIFLKLRGQKDKLNYLITRYKYGFFYSEFKPRFYFWEFIRLNLRILVIIIFTLNNQNLKFVYLLIIFIFGLYLKLVLLLNPIQNKQLQNVEIISNQLIILQLIFTSVSITYPNYVLELFIYIGHLIFVIYIIFIIFAHKSMSQLNLFGKIIWFILEKILTKNAYKRFHSQNITQFKTFQRWILIKRSISQIITNKALENAEKASFFQINSPRQRDETQLSPYTNLQEQNFSKTGFCQQNQDEIIENFQKSFYLGSNSISPNFKEEIYDENFNQFGNHQNQIEHNSSIFESKFVNISEKSNLKHSSDFSGQEKSNQYIQRILPSQYNIQLSSTINKLNFKNIQHKNKDN